MTLNLLSNLVRRNRCVFSSFLINPCKIAQNRSFSITLPQFADFGSRAMRKRFYKDVTVCESSLPPPPAPPLVNPDISSQPITPSLPRKYYEIHLDDKKLKTPSGTVLQVHTEMLAKMIAHEWMSQEETIKLNTMHLTSLLFTCLDNPLQLKGEQLCANIYEYLSTDTLLFFDHLDTSEVDKPEEWTKERRIQEEKWRPIISWMNERFAGLNLKVHHDLTSHLNTDETTSSSVKKQPSDASTSSQRNPKDTFDHYLNNSFDFYSLLAFNYMCESLKSVILSAALVEQRISTADEACSLSSLELEHQFDKWGKVEWHHTVNETELKSRVSAALLFIYLSSSRSPKFFRHEKGLSSKVAEK